MRRYAKVIDLVVDLLNFYPLKKKVEAEIYFEVGGDTSWRLTGYVLRADAGGVHVELNRSSVNILLREAESLIESREWLKNQRKYKLEKAKQCPA